MFRYIALLATFAASQAAFITPEMIKDIKAGKYAPPKTNALRGEATTGCCAGGAGGNYIMLNATSFVVLHDGEYYYPKMTNLATITTKLGPKYIAFHDSTHALTSYMGTYLVSTGSSYNLYEWKNGTCTKTTGINVGLPLMCFGAPQYLWNTATDYGRFDFGSKNLTIYQNDQNYGARIFVDPSADICAPIGIAARDLVGFFYNAYTGTLPDAFFALPTYCPA